MSYFYISSFFAVCRRKFINLQLMHKNTAFNAAKNCTKPLKVECFSTFDSSITWQNLLVKPFTSTFVGFCRILGNKRIMNARRTYVFGFSKKRKAVEFPSQAKKSPENTEKLVILVSNERHGIYLLFFQNFSHYKLILERMCAIINLTIVILCSEPGRSLPGGLSSRSPRGGNRKAADR